MTAKELLAGIHREHGDSDALARALAIAPQFIAAVGIQPVGRDTAAFNAALRHVIGEHWHARSERAYETLSEIAERMASDLEKHGLEHDLAALACSYMTPREDAAYSLGLAIGLTFAPCLPGVR